MNKFKLSAIKLALSTTVLSSFAFNVTAAEIDSASEVERIEVTGSRIKRTDLESAVPITTITRNDFAAVGALNVADVLNQSPVSITGLGTSNNTFAGSSIGLQTTQLRGLDASRTLVLVNGRRFVSGMSPSVGYAVDLNSIPTALIERIDILKSASSAVYGSDAVAGVINIITRKNIEGVEVDVQSGISSESDREKLAFNIASGASWDKGSFTMAMGYDEDKGLQASDRDFSRYDEYIYSDDEGNQEIRYLGSSFPPGARIGGATSEEQGTVGLYNGDGSDFDGSNNIESDRFNRAAYRQLSTPVERLYAAFTVNQELSESVAYFAEVNFNSTETNNSTIEPTAFDINDDVWNRDRGGSGGMDINSPLLPEALRQNLAADGITNLNQVSNFWRRMVEFGPRSTDVERSTIRIAQGLNFDISDDWAGEVYMSWGRTTQKQENGGQINVERAEKALDVELNADGVMQCVDANARLQGCVPLNLFGVNTVSAEAVDYVKSPATTSGVTEQFVVSGSISGELPLELAGGYIGTAFGIEHRLEKGQYTPGALAQVGSSSTNKAEPTNGSFYSNDVFAEFVLPVMDELTVDLAARYSDHEIVGGQTTWNAGLEYSPIEALKLRASAATAIRTPNIADLFGGAGETFRTVIDPCNGIKADGSDSIDATVRANCMSNPEIAARVAAQGEFTLTQVEEQSTGGTVGGNPNVKEETADTYSVGFIWQVTDGLDITMDYYDVSVENAIDTTLRTTVLNRCYAQAGQDLTCNGAFARDFKGALTEVHSSTSNENNIDTSGVDLEISYRTDFGPGQLSADLLWNHTIEYVQTSIADGTSVDYAGEVLNPENRANLNLGYAMDNLSMSWQMRYWDRSVDNVEGKTHAGYYTFASHVYHDLAASYQFTDTISGTFGIRNLFDKQPPVANQSHKNGSTGINTVPEAYDITGRYFNASVSMKF